MKLIKLLQTGEAKNNVPNSDKNHERISIIIISKKLIKILFETAKLDAFDGTTADQKTAARKQKVAQMKNQLATELTNLGLFAGTNFSNPDEDRDDIVLYPNGYSKLELLRDTNREINDALTTTTKIFELRYSDNSEKASILDNIVNNNDPFFGIKFKTDHATAYFYIKQETPDYLASLFLDALSECIRLIYNFALETTAISKTSELGTRVVVETETINMSLSNQDSKSVPLSETLLSTDQFTALQNIHKSLFSTLVAVGLKAFGSEEDRSKPNIVDFKPDTLQFTFNNSGFSTVLKYKNNDDFKTNAAKLTTKIDETINDAFLLTTTLTKNSSESIYCYQYTIGTILLIVLSFYFEKYKDNPHAPVIVSLLNYTKSTHYALEFKYTRYINILQSIKNEKPQIKVVAEQENSLSEQLKQIINDIKSQPEAKKHDSKIIHFGSETQEGDIIGLFKRCDSLELLNQLFEQLTEAQKDIDIRTNPKGDVFTFWKEGSNSWVKLVDQIRIHTLNILTANCSLPSLSTAQFDQIVNNSLEKPLYNTTEIRNAMEKLREERFGSATSACVLS